MGKSSRGHYPIGWIVLAVAVLAAALAWRGVQGHHEAESRPAGAEVAKLRFQGPILKAISVATADLLAMETQNIAQIPDPKAITEFHRCFTHLESYDVTVQERADRYVIEVVPVPERCLKPGETMHGGGGVYDISRKDFTILAKDYGE